MTGVLIKRRSSDTDICLQTDEGEASTSQETPKFARKPPEAGREACNRFPSQP